MIVCGDEVGLRLLQCCSFKLKQTGCKPYLLCYLVTSMCHCYSFYCTNMLFAKYLVTKPPKTEHYNQPHIQQVSAA